VMRSIPSTVKEAAPMELTAETQRRIMSTIKQNIIFANLDPPQLKVNGVRSVSVSIPTPSVRAVGGGTTSSRVTSLLHAAPNALGVTRFLAELR
jgi:hypothetical protein